jgi:hypothetical protein
MLALCLIGALALALWRSLRAGHLVAAMGVLGEAYGLAMDGANAVATRGRSQHAYEGFMFVFLGPSGAVYRDRGVLPTSDWFVEHPWAIHALLVLGASALAAVLLGQSGRIRPELPRARALDGIASPIVFFGAMDGVQIAMNLAISKLAD